MLITWYLKGGQTMETANEKRLQAMREFEDKTRKNETLGLYANVWIQMYVEDPVTFPAEFMMAQLVKKHAEISFDKIK